MASATFDLPEPLGPTTTATPGSRRTSTGSGNDLKPRILTARRYRLRSLTMRTDEQLRPGNVQLEAADAVQVEPDPRLAANHPPHDRPAAGATDDHPRGGGEDVQGADLPDGAAACTGRPGGRHLLDEDLAQQAADCVAVEHQVCGLHEALTSRWGRSARCAHG